MKFIKIITLFFMLFILHAYAMDQVPNSPCTQLSRNIEQTVLEKCVHAKKVQNFTDSDLKTVMKRLSVTTQNWGNDLRTTNNPALFEENQPQKLPLHQLPKLTQKAKISCNGSCGSNLLFDARGKLLFNDYDATRSWDLGSVDVNQTNYPLFTDKIDIWKDTYVTKDKTSQVRVCYTDSMGVEYDTTPSDVKKIDEFIFANNGLLITASHGSDVLEAFKLVLPNLLQGLEVKTAWELKIPGLFVPNALTHETQCYFARDHYNHFIICKTGNEELITIDADTGSIEKKINIRDHDKFGSFEITVNKRGIVAIVCMEQNSLGVSDFVKVVNYISGSELMRIPTIATINQLAFSPDGNYLAVACQIFTLAHTRSWNGNNAIVLIWDMDKKDWVAQIMYQGMKLINGLIFSPDGLQIITSDKNGPMTWDWQEFLTHS